MKTQPFEKEVKRVLDRTASAKAPGQKELRAGKEVKAHCGWRERGRDVKDGNEGSGQGPNYTRPGRA